MGQLTFAGAMHSCSSPLIWITPTPHLHKRHRGFARRTNTAANHLSCGGGGGPRACAAKERASYSSQQCNPLVHLQVMDSAKEGGIQSSGAFPYTGMKDSQPSSPQQHPLDMNSFQEGSSPSSNAFSYTGMKDSYPASSQQHPLDMNSVQGCSGPTSSAFTYTGMKDSQPSGPQQHALELNSVQESSSPSPSAFNYTSMKHSHLGFRDLQPQGLETVDDGGKGWINEHGQEDPLLIAHMLLIANLAADRAEMHTTIATQRDNWNKLFQSSLTAITMTATVLAAMGPGIGHNLSFSLPAFIMDAVAAAMMAGINRFQPSQLAEEQRTAARLCRKLGNDIKYSLGIAPQLRQEAQSYLDDTVSKLLAVDKAYPLPLTPMVIQKFPDQIEAPVISKHPDRSKPEIHMSGNGWSGAMSRNMKELGDLMLESDVKAYVGWARRVERINKCCAVGAPLLAAMAALMNGYDLLWGDGGMEVGAWAAVASALACIASSFSHDAQLGMIFELYRSSIGSFAEMEASIQRTIRLPVEKRERAEIFAHRLAYELGRQADELPSVPARDKSASNLF